MSQQLTLSSLFATLAMIVLCLFARAGQVEMAWPAPLELAAAVGMTASVADASLIAH